MNIGIIIFAVLAVGLAIKKVFFKGELSLGSGHHLVHEIPTIEKANDKLIVVSHAEYADVKTALIEFCKLYNKNDYAALPRLFQLPGGTYAITFPFDTDMDRFCFAVNYLRYAQGIDKMGGVMAWGTIKPDDKWPPELENKHVMMYVDKADNEYDNVSFTAEDNIAYIVPFTLVKPKLLTTLPEVYRPRRIYTEDLQGLAYDDIK